MVSINPAFQVLIASANTAAIAAGSTIDQLAPGQIGFFSYATNLAIDGTVPSKNKSFYIAVGVDRLAAGTIQDVNKSAGVSIEKKGIRAFTYKPYTAPVNKVIVLNVGKVQCNADYAVKFEIRSEIVYRNYGFNTPSKTFFATSNACSDTCVDCAAGDPNSVVLALAHSIAADPDGIFTTKYVDPANAGQYLTETTAQGYTAAHPGVTIPLEITVNSTTLYNYSQINLNYMDPRGVNAIMSILTTEGGGTFGVDTTQTTTQALVYEDGSGYDLQWLEYIAGGWNGKPGPYRTSDLVGLPVGKFETFATTSGHYNVYTLTYENTGIGGGRLYQSSLMTIFAVPTANTTALASINAILERIVEDAVGNDATVNTANPTGTAVNDDSNV